MRPTSDSASAGRERMALEDFQAAFAPILAGIVMAMIFTAALSATGSAARARRHAVQARGGRASVVSAPPRHMFTVIRLRGRSVTP